MEDPLDWRLASRWTALAVCLSLAVGVSTVGWAMELKDTSAAIDSDATGLTIDGMTLEATNVDRSARVYTANIADCRRLLADNPSLEFEWRLRRDPAAGSEYAIKHRRGSQVCELTNLTDDQDSECEVPVSERSLDGRTVRYSIRARTLLGVDGPAACDEESRTADVYFLFTRQPGAAGAAEGVDSDRIRLRLATSRPEPPSQLEVTPGESSLRVSWEAPSNADGLEGYVIYYATEAFDISGPPEDLEGVRRRTVGTATSGTVTQGVELGRTYWVAVTSRSDVLNESMFSEQVSAATVPVQDFWQLYRESGGAEEGGYCAAAGPGTAWPAFFALLCAVLVVRRRKEGGR